MVGSQNRDEYVIQRRDSASRVRKPFGAIFWPLSFLLRIVIVKSLEKMGLFVVQSVQAPKLSRIEVETGSSLLLLDFWACWRSVMVDEWRMGPLSMSNGHLAEYFGLLSLKGTVNCWSTAFPPPSR